MRKHCPLSKFSVMEKTAYLTPDRLSFCVIILKCITFKDEALNLATKLRSRSFVGFVVQPVFHGVDYHNSYGKIYETANL